MGYLFPHTTHTNKHHVPCYQTRLYLAYYSVFINIPYMNCSIWLNKKWHRCPMCWGSASLQQIYCRKKKRERERERRHYTEGTEWTHWSKKSSFCHVNWWAARHRLASGAESGDILVWLSHCIWRVCSSSSFWIVVVPQQCTQWAAQCSLLMSPVHHDSTSFTVSNALCYNIRHNILLMR